MKKYTLTDEHRAQLKPWADKWIANAMSTKPMDADDKAEMINDVKDYDFDPNCPSHGKGKKGSRRGMTTVLDRAKRILALDGRTVMLNRWVDNSVLISLCADSVPVARAYIELHAKHEETTNFLKAAAANALIGKALSTKEIDKFLSEVERRIDEGA